MPPSAATELACAFTRFALDPGRDVGQLADDFLGVAAGTRRVYLARDPDRAAGGLYARVDGGPGGSAEVVVPDGTALRPLLARLATVYADERGTDPLALGGRLVFTRPGAGGPVRLDVVFSNAPGAQHVTVTASDPLG